MQQVQLAGRAVVMARLAGVVAVQADVPQEWPVANFAVRREEY
jgi:hypothetical protein